MKLLPKKEKSLTLLRQAQGTLARIIQMIEEDAYCPDIIQQADSARGLLKSVKKELLAGHLDSCVMKKMRENKGQAIKELLKMYNLSD